jgi:SPOR domain
VSDDASIRTPTYRVARQRGMDPATKRLALIAAGLGSALLAVIGVWSVNGHHAGGGSVPVIEPPPGPMRVKPANPGGMQLAPGDEIFSGSGGDNSVDKLAPPPETPDPQALRPPPKAAIAPLPPAPQAAAAPVANAVPLPAPAASPAHPQQTGVPPAPSVSAAKPVVGVPPAKAAVQLAALPTEEAARQQWALLQHRLPDLLRGRDPMISKLALDGHIWWRVRTGGFPDAAAARAFCDQVHAKREVCDVIRP